MANFNEEFKKVILVEGGYFIVAKISIPFLSCLYFFVFLID